jgi:UDP-2,3-diacylglucosamine hydrolase
LGLPDLPVPLPTDHLFFSDLHLGRDPARAKADERALVACLEQFEGRVAALWLLGDLFEAWIEHRHAVPPPPARLFGLLARWADAGVRVTVFAGNHDAWYGSYLTRELGVRLVTDGLTQDVPRPCGPPLRLHLHHGDGLAPGGLYRHLRPLLRASLPVRLWKLMPADWGMGLSLRASSRLRGQPVDQRQVAGLRAYAERALARGDADAVVMGHSHQPERLDVGEGVYLNTGAWFVQRTFGLLSSNKVQLMQWKEEEARLISP